MLKIRRLIQPGMAHLYRVRALSICVFVQTKSNWQKHWDTRCEWKDRKHTRGTKDVKWPWERKNPNKSIPFTRLLKMVCMGWTCIDPNLRFMCFDFRKRWIYGAERRRRRNSHNVKRLTVRSMHLQKVLSNFNLLEQKNIYFPSSSK